MRVLEGKIRGKRKKRKSKKHLHHAGLRNIEMQSKEKKMVERHDQITFKPVFGMKSLMIINILIHAQHYRRGGTAKRVYKHIHSYLVLSQVQRGRGNL